jgi:hypothetical protein
VKNWLFSPGPGKNCTILALDQTANLGYCAGQNVHKSTKILEDEHYICCIATIFSESGHKGGSGFSRMHSKMARRARSHGQTPNSGQPTGKNPEKTRAGILGKKKRGR